MYKTPVFIGGCDRSGTTLLGSMLGSHDYIICVPESQFIIDVLVETKMIANSIDSNCVMNSIKEHPRFKLWGLNLDPDFFAELNEILSCPRLVEFIVRKYGQGNNKLQDKFWVDHTPSNIKYSNTLLSLFPNAKFIHLVRDGRAVASSIIPLNWGPNTIDQAAYFWLRNLAFRFADKATLDLELILRVKYKDLVENPEDTLITNLRVH